MAARSRLVVGALAAAATVGHTFYPAMVALASRGRAQPSAPPDPEVWPDVTVLVPAYNESNCIEAKVRDALANGYPGNVEVVVVADGDPETASHAEQRRSHGGHGPGTPGQVAGGQPGVLQDLDAGGGAQ